MIVSLISNQFSQQQGDQEDHCPVAFRPGTGFKDKMQDRARRDQQPDSQFLFQTGQIRRTLEEFRCAKTCQCLKHAPCRWSGNVQNMEEDAFDEFGLTRALCIRVSASKPVINKQYGVASGLNHEKKSSCSKVDG